MTLRERLQEYALIAEIIAAFSVVVSLVFVGAQVRQSNSIATTDAIRDATQIWVGAYDAAFGTEESTAFFKRAIHHCEELSDDERGRFFAVVTKFAAAFDNVYGQYASARLPQEVFVSIALNYHGIANTRCVQKVLSQKPFSFRHGCAAHLESTPWWTTRKT